MGGCFSLEDRRLNRPANENASGGTAGAVASTVVNNASVRGSNVDNGPGTSVVVQTITDFAVVPRETSPSGLSAANRHDENRSPVRNLPIGDGVNTIKTPKSNAAASLNTTFAGEAASSSNVQSRGGNATGEGVQLKCEPIRWCSSDPLNESQLRRKRETFWDTAPTYEGRPEIWAALRAAAEAFEVEDFALAQAVLNGAGIQLGPGGLLSESWDERAGGESQRKTRDRPAPPTSSSNNTASNHSAVIPTAADPDGETDTKVNNTYDAVNMLNVRLRFHYVMVPSSSAQPEPGAEIINIIRSSSRNSEKSSSTVQPTSSLTTKSSSIRSSSHSTAKTAGITNNDADLHAVPTDNNALLAVSPIPTLTTALVPVKDMKFPVSLLELVGSAKRRARDKFLQSLLLPGDTSSSSSSNWRIQHWFFAGRLLNDKQPINSIGPIKANFVIQVIIRERDLQQFEENHHHHHHHHTRNNKHRGGAASSNGAAAGGSSGMSFFSKLSGNRSTAAQQAAGSSISRPPTPAAMLSDHQRDTIDAEEQYAGRRRSTKNKVSDGVGAAVKPTAVEKTATNHKLSTGESSSSGSQPAASASPTPMRGINEALVVNTNSPVPLDHDKMNGTISSSPPVCSMQKLKTTTTTPGEGGGDRVI